MQMAKTADILASAAAQKQILAMASEQTKIQALRLMADALDAHTAQILAANALDIEAARGHIPEVMLDRLSLTEGRIASMAASIRDVAMLPDPVGRVLEQSTRPNGLRITKVSVPLGLVAVIYESRPNVTSDAAVLALKSGNACVLRGGKEAIHSNMAIVDALREGLVQAGLPAEALGLVTDTTRQSATELMTAVGVVDVLIPRGGPSLIRSCVENAKVPCIETGTGICHLYVDAHADLEMALRIVENAKTSRPSVCNAAEVCLVHKDIAPVFLPRLREQLVTLRASRGVPAVQLRLDPVAMALLPEGGIPAGEQDFDTEFLDYILAVRVVDNVKEAVAHIRAHSTGHSEAIITQDEDTAALFTASVDSAAVYVNASTRFTDGGEFGLGCEIGISTQKMHVRGPMGLTALTSYKYVIQGDGQVR